MNDLMIKDSSMDISQWNMMVSQAEMLVKSGFLPKAINTPEKALAVALKGRELGLPMMQSISSIHIIDGKPTISAELMAALVHQRIQGAVLRCVETNDRIATYEAGRPNDKILKMSFTWEEAQQAGVTGKDNWKKYPAAMLRARCCSAICRIVFPDAIMGVCTPDELGAITTEEGEPVDTINIKANIPQPQRKSEAPKDENPFASETDGLTVKDVTVKKGKNTKGKEWSKYSITTSDGVIYSTFSDTLGERAMGAMKTGAIVTVKGKESQYGHDLEDIAIVEYESAQTETAWTKDACINIITSSDSLETLEANWKSLMPHISKLSGPDKATCQAAYDETKKFIGEEKA